MCYTKFTDQFRFIGFDTNEKQKCWFGPELIGFDTNGKNAGWGRSLLALIQMEKNVG